MYHVCLRVFIDPFHCLNGRVVTMDARGCQGELARQIVDHEGANVLSLKENQLGSPRDGAELFAR